MIDEAIILAGGFGTRLAHILGDIPKPMAPVAGKPFLTYLLDKLHDAHFRRIVLATGYLHNKIENYFGSTYKGMQILYSEETQPLFTGGAIRKATQLIEGNDFLALNGDTLFCIDFNDFIAFHTQQHAPISIALRQVPDTSRYGAVRMQDNIIADFQEKQDSAGAGVINGGIYAINKPWLQNLNMPVKFSFEKDVLQQFTSQQPQFAGMAFDNYFIDIGIPDDYHKAQREFASLFPKDRFLFLDRDGVVNKQIIGDYVRSLDQWQWENNACQALAQMSRDFERTIIVSNQQGIGKGLFTLSDLDNIHNYLQQEIVLHGGKIDHIYVCTALQTDNSPMRKPQIGMALEAQKDYPEIDFTQSVMIGDSLTDMQFGYNAKMRCIFVTKGKPGPPEIQDYTDLYINNLDSYYNTK